MIFIPFLILCYPGEVPDYHTFDMQANYTFLRPQLNVKLGAANLLNQYYYSFLGGPYIGGFYYLALTFSLDYK